MINYRYFKYRHINKYSIDSLVKGNLFFAAPEKLNDPFDCRLDIRKSIQNAASKVSDEKASLLYNFLKIEELLKRLQAAISQIGICSFSLDPKNVLMWSHYADAHKGMSILYDFPEKYLNDGEKFIGISDVSYEQDSLTNWFMELSGSLPIKSTDYDIAIELTKKLMTIKSPDWEYEKEVRIIRPKPGVLKINKEYISQICFGLHTTDCDIELIREIVSQYNHKVNLCKVVRTKQDFGIELVEI
jgi:hypothetical protein